MVKLNQGIRSILQNGTYLAGSAWITVVLRAIYLIAITRFLGADNYGVWAYALATYAIAVGMVSFGAESLIPIRLAADKLGAAKFASAALTFRIILQAIAALAIAAFAILSEDPGITQTALFLSIPAFFGRGLAIWAQSVFVGFEQTKTHVRLSVAMQCFEVSVGFLTLWLGYGLISILVVHSATWLLQGGLSLTLINRHLTPIKMSVDIATSMKLLRNGVALGLAASLGAWMMAGPLVLLRQADIDLTNLGQIAFALQITALLVASSQPFLTVALPVLSKSKSAGDKRVAHYGRLTLLVAMAFGLVGAFIADKVGTPVLTFVAGADFAVAGQLMGLSVLICGLILAPAGYGQYMLVHGRRWHGVIGGVIGSTVLVAMVLAATETMDVYQIMMAVAAGWFARALVICVMGILEIRRQGSIDARL